MNQPVHKFNSIFLDQDLLTNPGKGNNTFLFTFPRTITTTADSRLSIANFSVPYSWFNVTKALGNNEFHYLWYDSTSDNNDPLYEKYQYQAGVRCGASVWKVILPDGFYTPTTMNAFLQFTMIQNGHYMKDANGNYIYFLEIVENLNYYRDQINSYAVSQFATPPAGWFVGGGIHLSGGLNDAVAGASGWPVPKIVFLITLTNTTLYEFFGFQPSSGMAIPSTDHPKPGFTCVSELGTLPPHQTSVHAICLTCNYVDNPLRSNAQHQVSTFVITTQNINCKFGEEINNSNYYTTWIPLLANQTINSMTFKLVDQEGDEIDIQDPDSNVELILSDLRYS